MAPRNGHVWPQFSDVSQADRGHTPWLNTRDETGNAAPVVLAILSDLIALTRADHLARSHAGACKVPNTISVARVQRLARIVAPRQRIPVRAEEVVEEVLMRGRGGVVKKWSAPSTAEYTPSRAKSDAEKGQSTGKKRGRSTERGETRGGARALRVLTRAHGWEVRRLCSRRGDTTGPAAGQTPARQTGTRRDHFD